MSDSDFAAMLARLHFAAERNLSDPELHLDAAAWIERLYTALQEKEAIISNQRAEIGRLQAQAIY